jgi:hypothetical protein
MPQFISRLDTVQPITQGRIVQLLIQNNLAVNESVVSAFKEIFD